ncbi:MAG: allantoicase [Egicoccus sp.]
MTAPTPDPDPAPAPEPLGLVDLAARRLGGMVLAANDEFFAPKEHLLEPLPAVFDPHAYADRGKVMDGWETRRSHDDGNVDWCVVRLGVPGVVEQVVVDTSFFRGNFPEAFALEGCVSQGPPTGDTTWFALVERTPLQGDAVQRFPVAAAWRATHVRLSIFPDGGVARLRVLGRGLPDLHDLADASGRFDLAAVVNGGRAVACSDAFFSSPTNLIQIGDARDMSDGWETRRRRGPGEDLAVLELAAAGVVERLEIDTTNFKGNYPDRVVVEALHAPDVDPADLPIDGWATLLPPTPLEPHQRHVFDVTADSAEATHLRLRVLPDGGVARLRAFGPVTEDGWRQVGLRRLRTANPSAAGAALLACCGSTRWVEQMLEVRPFDDPEQLQQVAGRIWDGLAPQDWLEAFAAHPRIGERTTTKRWSSDEQAGARTAEQATLDALEQGNRDYEERFGHVFLIRAAGRTADEMLAALRERLDNDPDTEVHVAAAQQREIMALRLDKLLREGGA